MKSEERIESLFLIKAQLEQWVSHMPEWFFLLHGGGEANIALQRVKQLIVHELHMQAEEELVDTSQSLDLYNLK